MYTHSTSLQTMRLSIALVTSGTFLLLYGAMATTPLLSAALLGSSGRFTTDIILPISPSVFFAGCLLIVGGAFLDVWRRLHR